MRVRTGYTRRRRHKKITSRARGFYGMRSRTFVKANETVMRALAYAYRDRRKRKKQFRSLWIARINALARANNTTYSKLMNDLARSGIGIDRKALAELGLKQPEAFAGLVALVS